MARVVVSFRTGGECEMRPKILTPGTVFLAFLLLVAPVSAQWLDQPDPRVPRTNDGKTMLTAKAPRTADGKQDLSGVWMRVAGENTPKSDIGQGFSLSWFMPKNAEIPLRPAAAKIFKHSAEH